MFSEQKMFKLIMVEFIDYAISWWNQLVTSRKCNGERLIKIWEEIKTIIRKMFLTTHFYREMYNKLQTLSQGFRSVDKYFKEMEVAMIRANIYEDREATMLGF
jgi:hypothetical protein